MSGIDDFKIIEKGGDFEVLGTGIVIQEHLVISNHTFTFLARRNKICTQA